MELNSLYEGVCRCSYWLIGGSTSSLIASFKEAYDVTDLGEFTACNHCISID